MMISDGRTEQHSIFFHITGFTNDFVSFIVVELIQFFHGALQLSHQTSHTVIGTKLRQHFYNYFYNLPIKFLTYM